MSSTPANTGSSFLCEVLCPPRSGQFHAMHPGNLDSARLDAFIADVWNDLTLRFQNPLRVEDDAATHRIYFIDTVCYALDRASGRIEITAIEQTGSGLVYVPHPYLVAVDLPLITTGGWLESYLQRWRDRMAAVMIDHGKAGSGESWLATVKRVFWRAIHRSTEWKRLRYALREALALDPKILAWSRHGRSRHAWRHVTDALYNRTVAHREVYARIERDNPGLVWLYTFMLDEKIALPKAEAIAAMKKYLQRKKVSPAGWRLLANGAEKEFRHIRDWIGPDGELTGRLHELPEWLRLVTALRRKAAFRPSILRLFLHDSFKADKDGRVCFRNVWVQVPVLKIILGEAERRLERGSLQSFANEDLVEVMTWLEAVQPVFDKNQLKSGWQHLAGRAVLWRVETELAQNLGGLAWRSVLDATTIGARTVVPLDDAWQVRQEALRQHHCADRYLRECLAGGLRLFSVRNGKGRPVATIGLELKGDTWSSFGIKLSCNRPVGPGLVGLDKEVAGRYTELWRLTQPVPPARPERIVRGDPVYFDGWEAAECPICRSEGVYCRDHTVACYDIAESILIGGSIRDAIEHMEEVVRAIVVAAVRKDIRNIGLGDDFNVILGYVREDMESMESLEAAIDNWSRKIRIALFDSALDQPEVSHTIADIDGGMPGLSSSYRSYWAADPDWIVGRMEERLEAVQDWLAGLNELVDAGSVPDEAVLRVPENRPGIEVSRDDPMLPAVIAMERALLKMMEKDMRHG